MVSEIWAKKAPPSMKAAPQATVQKRTLERLEANAESVCLPQRPRQRLFPAGEAGLAPTSVVEIGSPAIPARWADGAPTPMVGVTFGSPTDPRCSRHKKRKRQIHSGVFTLGTTSAAKAEGGPSRRPVRVRTQRITAAAVEHKK